jgi:hypothetical protein
MVSTNEQASERETEKTNVNPTVLEEYDYQEGSGSAASILSGFEGTGIVSNVLVFVGT